MLLHYAGAAMLLFADLDAINLACTHDVTPALVLAAASASKPVQVSGTKPVSGPGQEVYTLKPEHSRILDCVREAMQRYIALHISRLQQVGATDLLGLVRKP